MKTIIYLLGVGACLGHPLSPSVITKPVKIAPVSITFDREVIQQMHDENCLQKCQRLVV